MGQHDVLRLDDGGEEETWYALVTSVVSSRKRVTVVVLCLGALLTFGTVRHYIASALGRF